MGLIVHLTDLHLGPKGAATPTDDRKVAVVRDSELTTLRDDAEAAIKKLSKVIRSNGNSLSAVVISGDITVAGSMEGFADLKVFLKDSFGDLLPDPSRILAVPGNHDVTWFERDPAKRYAAFNKHCVRPGFITPPLEGLSLKSDGRTWRSSDRHALVDIEECWAIVPINSAAFSGVRSGLRDENGQELTNEAAVDGIASLLNTNPRYASVFRQLRKAREYDMARVSKAQIAAFAKTVEFVEKKFGADRQPLLLAALHHQLSPVSEREEIKAFESLSNLGRVRSMLQERGVNIIFHGHKHESRFFWDSREDASNDGRTHDRHDMLVLSGGTIGGGGSTKGNFANIVEITRRSRGHDVKVWSLGDYIANSENSAKQAIFYDGRRISPVSKSVGLIEGRTFDEAYSRLEREAALASNLRANDLVVRVKDGGTANTPPSDYPADASGQKDTSGGRLDDWFKDITLWWQSPLIEAPDRVFTHGRRLQLYDGKSGSDQIEAIARILQGDRTPDNGRAIATLIDPDTDTLSPEAGAPASFPAFCLVQLHVSNDGQTDRLDATAYFRKQEMRYWWPVNVAEIRSIMTQVLENVRGMKIGSITTVSAIAFWQTSRSRVAIPKIDRLYLQDHSGRTMLSKMAALLSDSTIVADNSVERSGAREMWGLVLDDIVPPVDSARDSIPVALEGIAFLRRCVEAQLVVGSSQTAKRILKRTVAALSTLEQSGAELRTLSTGVDLGSWKNKLKQHVQKMSEARNILRRLTLKNRERLRKVKT